MGPYHIPNSLFGRDTSIGTKIRLENCVTNVRGENDDNEAILYENGEFEIHNSA